MLTQEQKKKYLERGGAKCPFCGSEDLEFGDHDGASDMSWDVRCESCHKEWTDIYRLVNVTTNDEPVREASDSDEQADPWVAVNELRWFVELVRDFFTNDSAGHARYLREQAINALARAGVSTGEGEKSENEQVVLGQEIIGPRAMLAEKGQNIYNLKGHIFVLLAALKNADEALRFHPECDNRQDVDIETARRAIALAEAQGVLKIPFRLKDSAESSTHPDVPKAVSGEVEAGDHWVSIRFDGYGTSDQEGDRGEPVYLEYYDGVLRLNVWNDINSENHVTIDLDGAKVENFKEHDCEDSWHYLHDKFEPTCPCCIKARQFGEDSCDMKVCTVCGEQVGKCSFCKEVKADDVQELP